MTFDIDECRDHDKRLRSLEGKVAVAENRLGNLEKLPTLITALRDTVIELKTQTKVTWALLVIVFISIIGAAITIVQSGVLTRIP